MQTDLSAACMHWDPLSGVVLGAFFYQRWRHYAQDHLDPHGRGGGATLGLFDTFRKASTEELSLLHLCQWLFYILLLGKM